LTELIPKELFLINLYIQFQSIYQLLNIKKNKFNHLDSSIIMLSPLPYIIIKT